MTEPRYDMWRLIQGMAQGQGLATLDNIVRAVLKQTPLNAEINLKKLEVGQID